MMFHYGQKYENKKVEKKLFISKPPKIYCFNKKKPSNFEFSIKNKIIVDIYKIKNLDVERKQK